MSGVRNGKGGNSFVGKMSGAIELVSAKAWCWGGNREGVGVGLGRV